MAHLQVMAADGLAPQHGVEAEDLVHLRAGDAEVIHQRVDVRIGDPAVHLLDALEARDGERPLEAGGVAGLPPLELGDEVGQRAHRSHSPPIMFTEPKVVTTSASW